MNFTYYQEYATNYVTNLSIIDIILYSVAVVFIIWLFFFNKKKPTPKRKEFKKLQQNQEALQNYSKDSDEKMIQHLEGKKIMIMTQAKQVKQKYEELLKMNHNLKQKYFKVKKQLEVLK